MVLLGNHICAFNVLSVKYMGLSIDETWLNKHRGSHVV